MSQIIGLLMKVFVDRCLKFSSTVTAVNSTSIHETCLLLTRRQQSSKSLDMLESLAVAAEKMKQ